MPIRMNKDGNVDVLFDHDDAEGNWKELNNYRTFKGNNMDISCRP